MSSLSRKLLLVTVVLLFASFIYAGNDQAANPAVELKPIKYDALKAAVRAQRGKVVVVDIWADFCLPCKAKFPHLVELHKRHAKDGLVCMSISVDPAKDRDKALLFLREQNAVFANYWIDEKEAFWQEKFDLNGPPGVFIFDRQGRRAAKLDYSDPDNQFNNKDVEEHVLRLLKLP